MVQQRREISVQEENRYLLIILNKNFIKFNHDHACLCLRAGTFLKRINNILYLHKCLLW